MPSKHKLDPGATGADNATIEGEFAPVIAWRGPDDQAPGLDGTCEEPIGLVLDDATTGADDDNPVTEAVNDTFERLAQAVAQSLPPRGDQAARKIADEHERRARDFLDPISSDYVSFGPGVRFAPGVQVGVVRAVGRTAPRAARRQGCRAPRPRPVRLRGSRRARAQSTRSSARSGDPPGDEKPGFPRAGHLHDQVVVPPGAVAV
jgi:hypothetical protein